MENEKPKSDFQLRVDGRNVRECTCLETHIQQNGRTLCRQTATITHFVKFVTAFFFVAHGGGNDVIVTVSHGHITELNKL